MLLRYTHAHALSLPSNHKCHLIPTASGVSDVPFIIVRFPSIFSFYSHLHSSLSQKPVSQSASFQSQTQLDVNPHPSAPYDEMDCPNSYPTDDVSDDEYGTTFNGSCGLGGAHLFHSLSRYHPNISTSRPSKPSAKQERYPSCHGEADKFVTKLYQYPTAYRRSHFELMDRMINDPKSQTLYYVDRIRYKVCYTLPLCITSGGYDVECYHSFVVSNAGEFSRNIIGSDFEHNNARVPSFIPCINLIRWIDTFV